MYFPLPSANVEATVDVQDQQIPTTFDFETEHRTQSPYTVSEVIRSGSIQGTYKKFRHHGERKYT